MNEPGRVKQLDVDEAQRLLLETVKKAANQDGSLSLAQVINMLREQWRDTTREQLFLTCWYDLFRTGLLSWGLNFANPGMEHAHLTDLGKRTLDQLSRDPSNPQGYMATLDPILPAGSVARSYIEEALQTYKASCDKATAVMVGAASEALAIELRDALVDRMKKLNKPIAKALTAWQIKTFLDALEDELKPYAKKKEEAGGMPQKLSERFSSYWPSFTGYLRITRNEAGHPTSIEPVTRDAVHSALLIFPEAARLAHDLQQWVNSSYS